MSNISLTEVDSSERHFHVVHIPADSSKPVSTVSVLQKSGDALGCLINFCKLEFSSQSLSDTQRTQFLTQLQKQQGSSVPADLLEQLSFTTTVDMVVLQRNCPETSWVSVNMYVDDKGLAKELGLNERASAICAACGVPQSIVGDVYIGRQFDNNEGFCRIDFTDKDLSNEAWIKKAREVNSRMAKGGAVETMKKLPSQDEEERRRVKRKELALRNAAKKKEAGNTFFTKGDFQKAIEEYSQGLALLQLDVAMREGDAMVKDSAVVHALLSNRSACFEKLGEFEKALEDATLCASLRPTWPKAYGRQADALIGLKRFEEANQALKRAVELQPAAAKDLEARIKTVQQALGL